MTHRETWRERAIDSFKESICYAAIYLVALYGSRPILKSSSLIPPGFDSPMHFSKVRIFSQSFPNLPRWFPWWYCGTPSLRFYPPLSYFFTNFIGWLLQLSPLEAYTFTDLFTFYITGLSLYVLMRRIGLTRPSSVASAALYMLSPQTLYGRFFIGHFTHNFSMFLIPLTFCCIITYGRDLKKTILATAPLFALTFLSHLQTALSLGFMVAIYIFLTIIIRKRRDLLRHLQGVLIGGLIGVLLAGFWLVPSILEGMGRLSLTREAALQVMIPIESLFVPADRIWYLPPLQKIWCKQYFLGIPMIALSMISIMLTVKGEIPPEKRLWWSISASWVLFLLLAIVSPHVGLVLGWPNRLPYFVSMPMAMLAGFAIEWMEKFRLSKFISNIRIKRINSYIVVTTILLLSAIPVLNIESFIYYPYSNEIEVSRFIEKMGRNQMERVAFFGTLSYVFNAISNRWQLDGGYVQGQINIDFYYKYWRTLTKSNDLNSILNMLNKTNTRYIIFPKGQTFPSIYEDKRFFDEIETDGFVIFKLKDNYTLNFITLLEGKALLNYSYPNPDQLCIKAWHCSKNITIAVKMNYYPGWTTYSTSGKAKLMRDHDGLMIIQLLNADSADVILQYDFTQIDYIGFVATIAGALTYLITFLSVIWKTREGWTHTRHRGVYIDQIRKKERGWLKGKSQKKISETFKQKESLSIFRSEVFTFKIDLPILLSLSVLSIWYVYPYLTTPGVPTVVDTSGHFSKVWFLDYVLKKYNVFPVWCDMWYAGYPFLQFYPPLSYIAAATIGLLTNSALKGFYVTIALIYVLSSWFIYLGSLYIFKSRVSGIFASISYMFSPVVSGWVFFGAFPFVFGSLFLPLVIPLFKYALERSSFTRVVLFSILFVSIVLSHDSIIAFATLIIGVYWLVRCLINEGGEVKQRIDLFLSSFKILIMSIVLVAGFSAFYYLPFFKYQSRFFTGVSSSSANIEIPPLLHIFSLLFVKGYENTGRTYCGVFLVIIAIATFIFPKYRKHPASVSFGILAFLSAFLFGYQGVVIKLFKLSQIPFLKLINTYRYPFITVLSLSYLSGASVSAFLDFLDKFQFKRRRVRYFTKIFGLLFILLLIYVTSTDFIQFRTMHFINVPNASLSRSNSLYERLRADPAYYRIYVTFDADPLGLTCAYALHGRDIIGGWFIEGTPLREVIFNALEWNLVNPNRGDLIPAYFDLFAIKYFIASKYESRLPVFSASLKENYFNKVEVNGTKFVYFELKRPVKLAKDYSALLYIGDSNEALRLTETLLFSESRCILVRGKSTNIDDYSLDELRRFDGVLIYRWSFKDQTAAEILLRRYVQSGGTLLIIPSYPGSFLGTKMYYAESKGNCSVGYFVKTNPAYDRNVFNEVDITRFAPARYGAYPWGYIAFQNLNETLMWIDDNPVLGIQHIGKGKIVWIGFGLLKHINLYLNHDEGLLLRNLIKYVLSSSQQRKILNLKVEKKPYGWIRLHFDTVNEKSVWLLISECYFPGWKALVNGKPTPIYVGEPGLIMIKIAGSKHYVVSLKYGLTPVHYLGWTITTITFIITIVMLVLKNSVTKPKVNKA